MSNYQLTLDGHGECDTGAVITKDGEIIGIWYSDENDLYQFVPDGEKEVTVHSFFLGLFCPKVEKWHEGKVIT